MDKQTSKQVNKDSYNFDKYCGFDRWSSYYYQIKETIALFPKNVLEIGPGGDNVFGNYLKQNTCINYLNMDIAEDLFPDIVGNVEDIQLQENSFDTVCAFEVLEHLPFDKFEQSLKELSRVSGKHVIISLPHFGPPVKFLLKIPFLAEVQIAFKIPFFKHHKFNGQHYWEIGKARYSGGKIKNILKKYFLIKKEFIPFGNQYHHFYVLENII